MRITGSIFAALLTPFDQQGRISTNAIEPLVDFILSNGVHGLYASGSTGESALQNREERTELLTALADYAHGKCTLIAQVGSAATDDAVALARVAQEAGYDAVSAVPPFYYKHGFDDIRAYYHAIADNTDLPLIVYNIPALSGIDLTTAKLTELISDPRIAGVKYTASNLFEFGQMRSALPDKAFYFGTDEMFLGAAAMGTDGGIGSTYNLIGDVYVGIEAAVEAGDLETARALQAKANGLIEILLEVGVVPGLKYALEKIGVPVGLCRAPFRFKEGEGQVRLDRWLADNMQK